MDFCGSLPQTMGLVSEENGRLVPGSSEKHFNNLEVSRWQDIFKLVLASRVGISNWCFLTFCRFRNI